MSSASEADFRCQHGDTICGEFLSEEMELEDFGLSGHQTPCSVLT